MIPPRTACVFPGQGSQRKGMGGDLFDRFPALSALADAVLGYSIREICLENPKGSLRHTQYTQPALFVVNALHWLERLERLPAPDYLAGHSLGEYNALFAAGCFDFETGLRLVQKRGELMSRVEGGGMAAVLGLAAVRVEEVLRQQGSAVQIANFNLSTQLVLSGPAADLAAILEPLERAGARKCILLNVSGAFHSRSMEPVAEDFEAFLRGFTISPPTIPVIANTTALPYPLDPEAGAAVARYLVDQIRSPVRWSATMELFREAGVTAIEEVGPGTVLTKLWQAAWEAKPLAKAQQAPSTAPAKQPTPPSQLGSSAFRQDYGLQSSYVAGSPLPGSRPVDFVQAARREGILSFLDLREASAIPAALETLTEDGARGYGLCLRSTHSESPRGLEGQKLKDSTIDAALLHGVAAIEAVGYDRATTSLLRFRFAGAKAPRLLLAQVSSLRAAARLLAPAPADLIASLESAGILSSADGEMARRFPIASDLCVVPSGISDLAHLLPAVLRLAQAAPDNGGARVRVGAGGALGTPEAIAAAWLLGADFVQPGAIHLCCPETGLSPGMRRRLASLDPGDTIDAPAAHGFSLGAREQVVKKGSLFAPRAQKLYEIFRFYASLDALSPALRQKIEGEFFQRPLDAVWESLRQNLPAGDETLDPKQKMALVFVEYLHQTRRATFATSGEDDPQLHIPCDASLPAFNQRVLGTLLADAEGRSLGAVSSWLMEEARRFLLQRADALSP